MIQHISTLFSSTWQAKNSFAKPRALHRFFPLSLFTTTKGLKKGEILKPTPSERDMMRLKMKNYLETNKISLSKEALFASPIKVVSKQGKTVFLHLEISHLNTCVAGRFRREGERSYPESFHFLCK
jgi:hypothetical protein